MQQVFAEATMAMSVTTIDGAWLTLGQGAAAVPASGMPGATPVAAPATAPVAGEGTPLTGTAPVGGAAPQPAPGGMWILWMLPLMLLVMILISVFSGRKEKKRREQLISSISRGDRVQMFSGIIGYVQDMYDDEVVLRVEEGRIRFSKSAIQSVLSSASSKSGSQVEAKDGSNKPVGV